MNSMSSTKQKGQWGTIMDNQNQLNVYYGTATTPTFTAYQFYQTGNFNAIYLEELEGWDEDETFTLETEQKLIGNGSYIITSTVGERVIQITLNTMFSTERELRVFRSAIVAQMLALGDTKLERVFNETGETTPRKETVSGKITRISAWEQMEDIASIRITVTCVEPDIVVS